MPVPNSVRVGKAKAIAGDQVAGFLCRLLALQIPFFAVEIQLKTF